MIRYRHGHALLATALLGALTYCGGGSDDDADGGGGGSAGVQGVGGAGGGSAARPGFGGNPQVGGSAGGTLVAVCGDGFLSADDGKEACDDRNAVSNDGCSATCQVEPGWVCPAVGIRCQAAACGDGIIAGNERCDDGDAEPGDGCDANCQLEAGFACNTPGVACVPTVCGDTLIEGSEPCDDGNSDMGDGCSPSCTVEPNCPPEGGACTSTCGDGLHFAGDVDEKCEDGNRLDGDGCSKDCQIEAGYKCEFGAGVEPDKLELPLVLRDFKMGWNVVGGGGAQTPQAGGHPDFENNALNKGLNAGIVKAQLGTDGKPQYSKAAGAGGTTTTTGKTEFDQWYNDIEGVNQTVLQTMTLGKLANGVYEFDEKAFFPLDGKAFGNQNLSHNFHFTSEVRYWFEYEGGENLNFRGDDDVWVFINKKLVIDLGGVHGAEPGSVTLDAAKAAELGLEAGKVYEVVVWQAERHTTQSNYRLTLSGFVSSTSTCQSVCGDGVVTPDEACDDGPGNNTGGYGKCNADCRARGPYCGDGVIQSAEGETCDDGNNVNGDGCNANCRNPVIARTPEPHAPDVR